MIERQIVDKIVHHLRTLDGCWYYKTHGGPWGRAGVPDLLVHRHGVLYGLEVKKPGGKPTRLQITEMENLRNSGAVTAIVTSVNDVKEIMGA